MNIREFGQIVKKLNFNPIDNIESRENVLYDSEGLASIEEYYNESDRLTCIEYYNEVDDEYIYFTYKPGDFIDALRAGKEYNASIASYNSRYGDGGPISEMIPAIIAVNVPLYPIHINNIVFDDEELFEIYHENEGNQFSNLFNKTLLEYLYYQKESARKLELRDIDIPEIDQQIRDVKKWFLNNYFNPNNYEPFIPELSNKKTSASLAEKKPIVKEEYNGYIYCLADDMRYRKEKGEFETYREAYRHAVKRFTVNGKDITCNKLERNYDKAKSSAKVD